MLRTTFVVLLVAPLAGCLDFGGDDDPGDPAFTPSPEPSRPDEGPQDPEEQPGAPGAQPWVFPARDQATIRPGVQMFADGSQCTSNFVFLDPTNSTIYLGFAAHCVATGESTNSDGCDPANEPLAIGTQVEVQGATAPATLVYSSWQAMQDAGETDEDACRYNDFAVVAISDDDAGKVHPAMLGFGGPAGLADPATVAIGDKVLTFGATGLRPRNEDTDAREGYVVGRDGTWSTTAYIATPGLPGDSGSGVLTEDGLALGVLVTLGLAPQPGSSGITSLHPALVYAAEHGLPLRLATTALDSSGALPSLRDFSDTGGLQGV